MPAAQPKHDPRVTKRKVTMISVFAVGVDENGHAVTRSAEATDYVLPEILDAYVADAQTRWQQVIVGDEPDAGPAGYDGATFIPPTLDTPLANTYRPATDCGPNCAHAPEGATVVHVPQEG